MFKKYISISALDRAFHHNTITLHSVFRYSLSSSPLEEAYKSALSYLKQRNGSLKNQLNNFDVDIHEKLVFSDPHHLYRWASHKEELVLLKFEEMTNSQWRQNHGPQLTRSLAKLFHILATPTHNEPPILPYETEARLNLIVNFGESCVGRGNIILPEHTLSTPTVSFTIDSESLTDEQIPSNAKNARYASLFMVDLDYPDTLTSKLMHYCHWAYANIPIPEIIGDQTHSYSISSSDCTGTTWIPYNPPHPYRGTGYHRYLLILVTHTEPIQLLSKSLIDPDTRILDMYKWWNGNEDNQMSILSYVWFRSCWTKHVKDKQSFVFGNTKNPDSYML